MSQFRETHQPCPDCGSSDARAVYHSGVSICFSCGVIKGPDGETATSNGDKFLQGECAALTKRRIRQDTCQRYGYSIATTEKGQLVQVAPYYDPKSGRLVAQKVRTKSKDFWVVGDAKKMSLWGIQLARRNGRMIVITEGEVDALSISQAMGNTWPVVSLPGGAANLQALRESLEFLETYEKVVLAFDADEAGQQATQAALELFSPGKAHVINYGEYKDANDMLRGAGESALRSAVWEAREHRPDGIVSVHELYDRISAPLSMGCQYPWGKLNELTYGWRPGELVTWTAGTGTGKTALLSELEYYTLTSQKKRVGIIHLEEGCVRTARRLIGIHLNKPVHLPDAEYTEEEFKTAFDETIGHDRCYAYDHFGSLDADLLVNRIRYLAKGYNCEVIFLDHVSMVVSGADLEADERRSLDRIMTQLKSVAEGTGCTIHVVSHLRRPSGSASHEEGMHVSLSHLRGTQAIAQLSDCVIAAERNQQAPDETERNTTRLRVLKNRYTGLTGPADTLYYCRETGRLKTLDSAMLEEDF